MHGRTSLVRAAFAAAALVLAAAPAGAQAFNYPSFQTPRVASREFNFGFADADFGTSLLFQWREGSGSRNQLSLDVGFTDVDAPAGFDIDNAFFIGGQFGRQMTTSNANMPFDLMLTVGAGFATWEDINVIRIPVGISGGRRFPLEGGLAITPYIHPRFVIANCSDCADDTNLGLEFDIGGEFEFNPAFGLRLSASFGGDDTFNDDSFGVSLAWKPGRSMARSTRR